MTTWWEISCLTLLTDADNKIQCISTFHFLLKICLMGFERPPAMTANTTEKGEKLCFWCDLYVLRQIRYFMGKVDLVWGDWINTPAVLFYTCYLWKRSTYNNIIMILNLTYVVIYCEEKLNPKLVLLKYFFMDTWLFIFILIICSFFFGYQLRINSITHPCICNIF